MSLIIKENGTIIIDKDRVVRSIDIFTEGIRKAESEKKMEEIEKENE